VLARWAGWGALPKIFDEDSDQYVNKRVDLRRLLGTEEAWAQARRTTINAHYTSADVVQAVWLAVEDLGFDGGRVLEPGCGSGNFLGFAPEATELVGIELDPTTAMIADHLYGSRARIHQRGFEDFNSADEVFDLVIGNVPFAKVRPFDRWHNVGNHTLHNYFVIKSLHLTRPGGILALLTSRYTLDAASDAARREMGQYADLVGAIRLPARTFAASSGTDVVMDLLILRRRALDTAPKGSPWLEAVPIAADLLPDTGPDTDAPAVDEPILMNEYLADHPDRVLGTLAVGRGMYREHELTVKAREEPSFPDQLNEALNGLVVEAREIGLGFEQAKSRTARTPGPTLLAPPAERFETRYAQEGSLVVGSSGGIGRLVYGEVEPYTPPNRKDISELRRLIGLRDAARAVLAVQLAGGAEEEFRSSQDVLSDRYESYRRIYGPINRFTRAKTGHKDPDTGAPIMRQNPPSMGGFRGTDPDWPLVAALEIFDNETQEARKAEIFTQRIVAPPARRTQAATPADAVAVCLDESHSITIERVAELLGVDDVAAHTQIADLVFEDPGTGELIHAARYLSGNIRQKLRAAHNAVERDGADRWRANVAALKAALPRQLEPGEISARLGSPWIPASDVEAFCEEVLDATVMGERLDELGAWTVSLKVGDSHSVVLTSEWGTQRASAINLLNASLNQRLYTVYDTNPDKTRVRNDAETLAAREKQEALSDRFSTWVWEHPPRAARLAETYNELFCSVALTHHDGSYLTLPGLAATFTPRPHQRDAVARILTDGRALLAHAVGAGKTATMVMAAMELRRLGSASKPAVAVPNHMLEQFSREWLQLYPTARILIADNAQLSKDRRKEFVARCATGDWDGVVFTHSGFEHIALGGELRAEYMRQELDASRRALGASKDGNGLSVKKLEAAIARLEQTYKKLLAEHSKDDGVRFEETGIDYVFVDEAHLFKNRRIVTSIDGVASKGSGRAQDLDSKLWALRKTHGVRCATFATATPVANSMAELWVMQSYLQPDVLKHAGVRVFDSWAANFGRTHTALELAPDGGSYRMKTRFARFQNIPELLSLFHQVADVRSSEDLQLPTPSVEGGQPATVVVPPSPGLREFVTELAARATAIQSRGVRPEVDNMLAVTGDGRRAALDLRLVGRKPDPEGGKIAAAARPIAGIYHATRETQYVDAHGSPPTRPGALQLVFCDVSTPAADGWNAYDELRDQLVRRGVPVEMIRYVQQAKTHVAKARLFAACREGSVAVLMGSTETMGVGTNVQARAITLHHLDAPWRPADIEQRDGRILRQGNQNETVEIIRYVTEGSFDTYMWQTLERKAAFIAQISSGRLGEREVDDIGEQVLSFAEVKALSTGDPRIMEKAGVDADVARLTRLEHAYHDDQRRLRRTVDQSKQRAEKATARAARLEDLMQRVTDTQGDKFTMTVDGQSVQKRQDAGEQMVAHLQAQLESAPSGVLTEPQPVGELAGLTIEAQITTVIENEIRLRIPETTIERRYLEHEWKTIDPARLIQGLERSIRNIPELIATARADAAAATQEAERADARLGQPWEHADQLTRLRHRQQELNEQLTVVSDEEASELSHPDGPGVAAGLDNPVAMVERAATKAVAAGGLSLHQ
jgi:N12 class adenine-specific DNA methylase